jgi:hypothetical protein
MSRILAEVERLQPGRVVLDSCSELRLLAQSELRYRRQILALKRSRRIATRAAPPGSTCTSRSRSTSRGWTRS